MEHRYGALRVIGTIYKIFGIIVAILTVLAVLLICATAFLGVAAFSELGRETGVNVFRGGIGALIGGIFATLYGGGLAITLYAAGDFIYLLLALEENTRTTAMLLRGQPNTAVTQHGQ
jgi:hypothetical protein